MKRIVIGTFSQCIKVLKANKRLKSAGYTHCDLQQITLEEYEYYHQYKRDPDKITYNENTIATRSKDNLYKLELYR